MGREQLGKFPLCWYRILKDLYEIWTEYGSRQGFQSNLETLTRNLISENAREETESD
jgi:hypothetical protein